MDTLTGVEHLAEPDGFRDFVEARSSALLRSGWLLTGDWPSAEDLVQTALAAAWPRWASLRRQDAPELYVRKIMVNTFLRWRQRRWNGEVATGRLPETQAHGDVFAQVDARQSLLAALDRLPARQRAVVVLRYFADQNRVADRRSDGLLGGRGEVARVEGAGPAQARAGPGRAHDRRGGVMNTEERQLADVLHRVTPEPPRRVTVEQVAYRLVSEPRLGRGSRAGREPRPRRGGLGLSRAWAPALAAAAVVVIAGASVGVAVLASSHHNSPSPPAALRGSSATASSGRLPPRRPRRQPRPSPSPATPSPARPGTRELIDHQTFLQGSLVSRRRLAVRGRNDRHPGPDRPGHRDRRGDGPVQHAGLPNPPVVVGNTVWVVWSYSGGNVVLHGYNASTLAQTSSVLVPAIGQVSIAGLGVLTGGPDGNLYVAAGDTVAEVNPTTGQVTQPIYTTVGEGQLGGGLTRRQQAVRRHRHVNLLQAAGLRSAQPHRGGLLHPDAAELPGGIWSRPRAGSGARPAPARASGPGSPRAGT